MAAIPPEWAQGIGGWLWGGLYPRTAQALAYLSSARGMNKLRFEINAPATKPEHIRDILQAEIDGWLKDVL